MYGQISMSCKIIIIIIIILLLLFYFILLFYSFSVDVNEIPYKLNYTFQNVPQTILPIT